MERAGQKCLRVPRKASHYSSGISGHTAGSSGALQSIPGKWHAVSGLIGPHKEPHEENRDQDHSEVETQLPGRQIHSQSGSVRTEGRLLQTHRRPPAGARPLTESNKESMGPSVSIPSSKETEAL